MNSNLTEIWVYLSASPLLHLTMTLVAYQIGMAVYRRTGMNPLVNPVLIAVAIVVGLLIATETDYTDYFDGAQFVHFLLGPATVALAIPLYRQIDKVRRASGAILTSIVMGSAVGSASAVGVAWILGGSMSSLLAIAPKSVTAPVAMGIAQKLGGLPSLTAVLVIITGILGASLGPYVLDLIRVRDWTARGLAIGTASHGIGTARAIQVNAAAGAFSGLAMGINALATAILLPLVWRLFF
ncbi:MAG: LrgB family protein [Rhodospirillaceae bacterium]